MYISALTFLRANRVGIALAGMLSCAAALAPSGASSSDATSTTATGDRAPLIKQGALTSGRKTFEGRWAQTKEECLDDEGPNSLTLIDLGNVVEGKATPIFDQYENHCLIERTNARDETTNLDVTCFEFWENFTKREEGRKAIIRLSTVNGGLRIDGKTYRRCEAMPPQSNVAADSHTKPVEITSLSAYANQIKHQWVKYAEENIGAMHQISYIDLASIIRTGDTLTVLDLQDWTPFLEVMTTGEHLGSSLSLVKYDCGSTPRLKNMAGLTFYGHMGAGARQDGGTDIPKEPSDGWYVMPAHIAGGKINSMLKARETACNGIAGTVTKEAPTTPPSAKGVPKNVSVLPRQDNAVAVDLANCDQQAQQRSATASTLSPIDPVSVLNPILLLNDINRRKQQEANQPNVLAEIEAQRQGCRQYAETAAAKRAQEVSDQMSDDSRGYKRMSLETFVLDAKTLATNQSRLSVKGVYVPDGDVGWLLATQGDVMRARVDPAAARTVLKIPLLTDDANREFRQYLLSCRSNPGTAQVGCPIVVSGHASMCHASNSLGANLELPCIAVETGRSF